MPDDERFRETCRGLLSKSTTSARFLRGLMVLSAFPSGGEPRRVEALVSELNMKYATVQVYLVTLVAVGLLEYDAGDGLYRRRPV